MKFQVGSGDKLGNGCFGDANLPGILGLSSAKVFTRLFELGNSGSEVLQAIERRTTTARVLSSESIGSFGVSMSAITEMLLAGVNTGADPE